MEVWTDGRSGSGPKQVSPTRFWCVNLLILLVGSATLRDSGPSATKPLQRDQTEEWKGWMQIMFVLYHYFAEAEIYNAIRLYIAAYVWMTGFGNFSYYYIRKDFTLPRFMQMMWRLNFFVFFTTKWSLIAARIATIIVPSFYFFCDALKGRVTTLFIRGIPS